MECKKIYDKNEIKNFIEFLSDNYFDDKKIKEVSICIEGLIGIILKNNPSVIIWTDRTFVIRNDVKEEVFNLSFEDIESIVIYDESECVNIHINFKLFDSKVSISLKY